MYKFFYLYNYKFAIYIFMIDCIIGIGLKGKTLDPEKGSYVQADFEKAIELSSEFISMIKARKDYIIKKIKLSYRY